MPRPRPIRMGRLTVRATSDPDETGRCRWRLEWYPAGAGGTMRTESLGPRGARYSRAAAEELASQRRRVLDLDAPPEEAAPAPVGVDTVERLLREWVTRQHQEQQAGLIALRTFLQRQESARRLLGGRTDGKRVYKRGEDPPPRLRYVPLAELDRDVLERWRNDRLAEGMASATVAQDLCTLRMAWAEEVDRGRALPRESLPKVKMKVKPHWDKYTPTPAEVEAVLGAMHLDWHRAGLCLLWGTGARLSGVMKMRWGQVDPVRRTVHIIDKHNPRTIPITPRAQQGLSLLEPATPAAQLFSAEPATLRVAIYDACQRAGVERFSPNGLRRLAVDELRRAGVPLEVVAAITGHSIQVMLSIYRQASAAEVQAALAQEGAPLGGPVAEPLPFTPTDRQKGR